MKSKDLYKRLKKDFVKKGMTDEWIEDMADIQEFISDEFKKEEMGLVCDFNEEVYKVYTAVFPSDKVMKEILKKNEEKVMLFVHHPMIWNLDKAPPIFYNMNKNLLKKFKESKISIFNYHVPLDNFSEYSTSNSLAKAFGLKVVKKFAPYHGGMAGVICNTKLDTIEDVKKRVEDVVGHKVKLYKNGDEELRKVAVIAGGGFELEEMKNAYKEGCNLFITGVTQKSDFHKKNHEWAMKNGMNVIGATHYSTEKFACINMCDYFKKLGIDSEFIEDSPMKEDM
ncbi:MAG: Nif3-like dinuclear metal center hexameric protein [Nanoarchaeota archaeon]|nr:Nif3-like dinuclear metal center hexameric protein [Nanoarchaeota archaeon]